MAKRVERPGVREGYDRWSTSYDATPNPVVALDRRHTLAALDPRPGEWILDAGCGAGAHLRAVAGAGGCAVGLDLSRGMLAVARRASPASFLVQADLDRDWPVRPERFDALISALVSEHLRDLATFFAEAFAALRRAGRIVFSAFHPEAARAGVEANFEQDGIEYRLGAEPYTIEDYLERMAEAGFRALRWSEHAVDAALVSEMPHAGKYLGRPLLLLIEARRPSSEPSRRRSAAPRAPTG
jgi:malonyl-CoA O-methyltransferase